MRKDQKILLGFVGTLVGVAGTLAIYLPQYSTMALQARERASRMKKASGEGAEAKPSASMWKNIDKKRGGE